MRLLHTRTLTFREFFGQQVPSYCILSHRWSDDEVRYQDMVSGKVNKSGKGYLKLVGACRLGRNLGWTWIWIDAVCIDKASSSELGEAINSMMKWYTEAAFCIAYLADVSSVERRPRHQQDPAIFDANAFRQSNWWTRGWTLQELIAPRDVYFYNSAFEFIGSKSELSHEISNITGMEAVYLDGRKPFTEACIATRMSWSSARTCTRKEDEAYCLLGLMQVTMPLLYGEGSAAFIRLQLQILSQSNDETIFAWLAPDPVSSDKPFGILAESARYFARSNELRCSTWDAGHRLPYSYSNRGLQFSQYTGLLTGSSNPNYTYTTGGGDSPTVEHTIPGGTYIKPNDQTRLTLRCYRRISDHRGKTRKQQVAIEIRRVGTHWYRVDCSRFLTSHHSLTSSGLIAVYYIALTNQTIQPNIDGPIDIYASADARRRFEDSRRKAARRRKQEKRKEDLWNIAEFTAGLGFVAWMFH